MQHILVVCGAGASSTFLVHWMRRDVADRGLAVTVDAAAAEDLPARLADADVLLVGNHLADAFDGIERVSAEHGVAAVPLPALSFDPQGARVALDLARDAGRHESDQSQREPETTHG